MPILYFSTDDQWQNAIEAFIACTPSDPKPLARLLRSSAPISAGTRDALAEMLDPDGDGYLHLKLELVSLENKRRGMGQDLKSLEVTVDYRENQKSGTKNPAEATAIKFDIEDASTVYRRLLRWKKIQSWLKGKSPTGTK